MRTFSRSACEKRLNVVRACLGAFESLFALFFFPSFGTVASSSSEDASRSFFALLDCGCCTILVESLRVACSGSLYKALEVTC